ncbi:response regulator transcription factor [Caballeronia sp. TF1N1]|uniref:response regulator n=1 Tax=Caballeronia sp. TF1N1 TaxID=2878153 RepID=UPI001FD2F261|nr:response regulator transcription factor [Caballeronia sp. TF1N1]
MTPIYKINIVIADDQPVVLLGLQSWFEARGRYRVAATARNAAQLFTKLERTGGDLIVMDCAFEGAPGGEFPLLRMVRERFPDVPVVAFTQETEPNTLFAMQEAGAAGIVSKCDEMREMERVCQRALSGATGIVSRRIAAYCNTARSFDINPSYRDVRVSVKTVAS